MTKRRRYTADFKTRLDLLSLPAWDIGLQILNYFKPDRADP